MIHPPSCRLLGWSTECLQEWGPFLRLAIPSMLMLCLEWWLYEIAGFLAGIISEVELGAQSIVYQLASIAYMVTASHIGLSLYYLNCFGLILSNRTKCMIICYFFRFTERFIFETDNEQECTALKTYNQ